MPVSDFDPFVLPFSLGVLVLVGILTGKFIRWMRRLSPEEKMGLKKGFNKSNLWKSTREVIAESLLHHNMFRRNAYLGYMHMTFALGWLLLILAGNLESRIHSGHDLNPPYYPIFFKFFVQERSYIIGGWLFIFLMDLFLLFVLSGLALAMFKRSDPRLFGMKKSAKLRGWDHLAMIALWCIFPLRLLAESFTSGYTQTGGFLTGTLGMLFNSFLPVEYLSYPAWWAYSMCLMVFFISIPFTRYMHIPAEVLLIFARNMGMKPDPRSLAMARAEVNSCSRCGVCISVCPVSNELLLPGVVPVYYFKKVREGREDSEAMHDCLLCGRCGSICPVGVHPNEVRIRDRLLHQQADDFNYDYLIDGHPRHADVVYFAGCMGHLTPSVKKAVNKIMLAAGVNFFNMDEQGGVCCGRPLKMQGRLEAARAMVEHNQLMVERSGARMLVTSCPICLKGFKEDYSLRQPVLHHSEFILMLLEKKKINVAFTGLDLAYHDPCELGRGCGITESPLSLIAKLGLLQAEGQESDCCGGSLGNITFNQHQRDKLTDASLEKLLRFRPDMLITACPLCKKTFSSRASVPVKDIAELAADSLVAVPGKKIHAPAGIYTI